MQIYLQKQPSSCAFNFGLKDLSAQADKQTDEQKQCYSYL